MPELPIWVWVLWVLGVFAAGIGLGYLIIFLFWKIERYIFPYPEPPIRKNFKAALKVKDPIPQPEPQEAPILEKETVKIVNEEVKEEIAPVPDEPIRNEKTDSSEEIRLIKFATILRSRFNHPFREADRIICWDIALQNGDEVSDTEGKVMKLRVIEPQSKAERKQYILSDESGQQTISLIHGKDYIKKETTLDFDKLPKSR